MKPVRVLYVSGGSLDYGGITAVMLNYASRMDRKQVAVDFLVHGDEPGPREAEAKELGAAVIHVPHKRQDYLGNRRALGAAMAGYPVVHAHMDGMNGYALSIAKAAGVPHRISHCHNTRFLTENPARVMLHRLTARKIKRVATDCYACSPDAGRFLYGEAYQNGGKVTVIRNAIHLSDYEFSGSSRARLRQAFGIEAGFAIGCVGRYAFQKNQGFLIDLFPKVLAKRPDAVLLLIGDGEDRPALEQRIQALGLTGKVLLLGYRPDVKDLFSALDFYAFPSRFEGLGIALVEAQASGLACIASDQVPRDTRVTECDYLPLTDKTGWADALVKAEAQLQRRQQTALFQQAGYDIDLAAQGLAKRYLEMCST